jgi:TolB protein
MDNQVASQKEDYDLKIAYNVLEDSESNNYEVYIMDLDGTNATNLTNWKGVDWVYYAFDERIYFVSDRDTNHRSYFLYEMHVSGDSVRKIYNQKVYDSWISSRNDGHEFIVTTEKDSIRTFVIIDRFGKEMHSVFGTRDYQINDPCFSPDGKWIVYRSKQSGLDELWIMDENGAHQRQLTHYPKEDTTTKHFYHAGPPFWVSQGNFISFISRQNDNYSIFIIEPDGKNLAQITDDKFNEGWHYWSPKGDWIVFDGANLKNENFDIYLMKRDGSSQKRLTSSERFEQAPVFVKQFKKTLKSGL